MARRTAYTLYVPPGAQWRASDAQPLAQFWSLFPQQHAVPITAWRAVLLAYMQCAERETLLPLVREHVRSTLFEPLKDACSAHIANDVRTYEPWAKPVQEAQSVRWCTSWWDGQDALPSQPSLSEQAAQLADTVVAIASATAAKDAGTCGAYVERLAARLVLLARQPTSPLGETASYLTALATTLHPAAAAWDADALDLGETCVACQASIPFTLAQYAHCAAGHVFGRCFADC